MNSIKLICFDLNKTLIAENTWLDLNKAMGVTEKEDQMMLHFYEEDIITYNEWQTLLTKIYKVRGKATRENVTKTVFNYSYKPQAKETIKYLQEKGYQIALITGSLQMLAERVAQELGIELYAANNILIFNEKDYLESLSTLGDEQLVKLRHLESFCRRLGIEITACACVGDGANDALMFERTQHGITFPESKIKDKSWRVINGLSELQDIF